MNIEAERIVKVIRDYKGVERSMALQEALGYEDVTGMGEDNEYNYILEAAEMCVENPAIDHTALGRIKRMSNIFSEDELNTKIGLLVDVIFTQGVLSA